MITSTYTPEYYSLWYFSGHFYTRQKCINSTVEAPFYRGHGGILQPYCRCSEKTDNLKNRQNVNISPPGIGLWRAPMFVPVTTLGQYKTTNFNGFPTKEKDFLLKLYSVYRYIKFFGVSVQNKHCMIGLYLWWSLVIFGIDWTFTFTFGSSLEWVRLLSLSGEKFNLCHF